MLSLGRQAVSNLFFVLKSGGNYTEERKNCAKELTILGKPLAELPLIGRSLKYRGNGMKRVVRDCSSYILKGEMFSLSIMAVEQSSLISRKKA